MKMNFFSALDISASGLVSYRARMNTIANNIANVNTTNVGDGTPFQRQFVELRPVADENRWKLPQSKILMLRNNFDHISELGEIIPNDPRYMGVRVSGISTDQTPGQIIYDPAHPDADENGYVTMPNVNIVQEMVNMMTASRSYEANITALNQTKQVALKAISIIA